MKKFTTIIAIAMILVMSMLQVSASYLELLENNRFEKGVFTPDKWTFWTQKSLSICTLENTGAYTGKKCIKITNAIEDTAGLYYDVFSCTPGKTYTLSGYIKAENCTVNDTTNQGAQLAVQFKKTQFGQPINNEPQTDPIKGSADWKYYSVTFIVPTGITDVVVICRLWGGIKGTAWFDDVSLVEGTVAHDVSKDALPSDSSAVSSKALSSISKVSNNISSTITSSEKNGGTSSISSEASEASNSEIASSSKNISTENDSKVSSTITTGGNNNEQNSNLPLVIGIVFAAVIVVGAILYFFVFKKKKA